MIADRLRKRRIIDVSRAAARALGIVERGITTVRIEWLSASEKSNELVLQDAPAIEKTNSNHSGQPAMTPPDFLLASALLRPLTQYTAHGEESDPK
jgi:rare lipoprotein A (peptidoglycan hydrolase)